MTGYVEPNKIARARVEHSRVQIPTLCCFALVAVQRDRLIITKGNEKKNGTFTRLLRKKTAINAWTVKSDRDQPTRNPRWWPSTKVIK